MKRKAHSNSTERTGDFALVLNAGSSSLRFALFDCAASPHRVLLGKFDRIGTRTTSFTLINTDNQQNEHSVLNWKWTGNAKGRVTRSSTEGDNA